MADAQPPGLNSSGSEFPYAGAQKLRAPARQTRRLELVERALERLAAVARS
jgi:hypothetical protein